MSSPSLDLALIGNCTVGALIDHRASIVWTCLPRFDGDAVFCTLLGAGGEDRMAGGYAIDLVDFERAEQHYGENTAILVTRLHDRHGGCVEVIDFAPRFNQFGRTFRPMMLIRRLKRISGSPRLSLHVRPLCNYGAERPAVTWGSNHVRYVMPDLVLRLTTNASITAVMQETPFFLDDEITLVLGPDESIHEAVNELARRFHDETAHYWREWVRFLGIPYEWQDETIRAAITLKLNAYDDTGAIIAAMTTSIPEAANSVRNWDYRFCWLRDAYFVINVLNRLGATRTMERYLAYILNIAASANGSGLQPVYAIDGRSDLTECEVTSLAGYRGMGPVRVGNQAWQQVQHDVYGSAILAATHVFFDRRLIRRGDEALFRRLEPLGEKARALFDQPDAGIWELRTRARVHTSSALMCWAACDRLARIAVVLGLPQRASLWHQRAGVIRGNILEHAWSAERQAFVESLGGRDLDASVLLMAEVGFLPPQDPRFVSTVQALEHSLCDGAFMRRYEAEDDFGRPQTAFNVCSFWRVDALARIGRREQAREAFGALLARRNKMGLLSEDLDPVTGELWGNFPQTYSMVGIINGAVRLSAPWDSVV